MTTQSFKKRHERHLMRQRGAGARALASTSGFTFNATKRTVPLATGSETPARTPMRKRLSMVARTPPKTPLKTLSKASSRTPATARKSVRKALESARLKEQSVQTAQHTADHELPVTTSIQNTTISPARITSKTPSRAPFIEKRKTITTATESSLLAVEQAPETGVKVECVDAGVEGPGLGPVIEDMQSVSQQQHIEPVLEEPETMIVHKDAAIVHKPSETEEAQTEPPVMEGNVSTPLVTESERAMSDESEPVKESTARLQRKTTRRRRKLVTMPKSKKKAPARTKIEDNLARDQLVEAPSKTHTEKAPAKTRTRKSTKAQAEKVDMKVADRQTVLGLRRSSRNTAVRNKETAENLSTQAESIKQSKTRKGARTNTEVALVEAEKGKQPTKRKRAVVKVDAISAPMKAAMAKQTRKKRGAEESIKEIPVKAAKMVQQKKNESTDKSIEVAPHVNKITEQSKKRKRADITTTDSTTVLPTAQPVPHYGGYDSTSIDNEKTSTLEEVEIMLKKRKVEGADARMARIRAGRRKMWRHESISNIDASALLDLSTRDSEVLQHTLVSPAKSVLSRRDSNLLTPSPIKNGPLVKKQKVSLTTKRTDRADKENMELQRGGRRRGMVR